MGAPDRHGPPLQPPQQGASVATLVAQGSLAQLRTDAARSGLTYWRNGQGQNLVFVAAQRRPDLGGGAEICKFLVEELRMAFDDVDEQLRQTPLFFAATSGAADVAAYLLKLRAEANRADSNVQTPLFYAARHGRINSLLVLLEQRADPSARDVNGQAALFYAAKFSHASCVEALLRHSPSPLEVASARDKWDRTALFYATDPKCCKLVLECHCAPNTCDIHEQSALFDAARNAHEPKLDMLIQWKANVDLRDKNKQTALFFACDAGHVETCRMLLAAAAGVHYKDRLNQSPLKLVQSQGNWELINLLQSSGKLGGGAKPGILPPEPMAARASQGGAGGAGAAPQGGPKRRRTSAGGTGPQKGAAKAAPASAPPDAAPAAPASPPSPPGVGVFGGDCGDLPRAVYEGTPQEVRQLIEAGHSPKVLNSAGLNLVFQAAVRLPERAGHAREICKLLVEEHNLSPTYVDIETQTPLFHAVRQGHADCSAYLIDAKCDVHHRDVQQQTPLFCAARFVRTECLELLLERLADPNLSDSLGRTPLFEAAGAGVATAVELLLRHGACARRVDKEHRTCLFGAAASCVMPLAKARCDPNACPPAGQPPIFAAAEAGEEETLRMLLEARASLDTRDPSGQTALHLAVRGRQLEVCTLLIEGHGADLGAADNAGVTPLQSAFSLRWTEGARAMEEAAQERQRLEDMRRSQQQRWQSQLANVVRNGPVEQLRDFLQSAGEEGMEAAHSLDGRGRSLLCEAALRPKERGGALGICQHLVEEVGLDPSYANLETGQTALFEAAAVGNSEVCSYLVSRKCDVAHTDNHGRNALFSAVFGGHVSSTRALMEARVEVDAKDKSQQTALFYAVQRESPCAELLLKGGATPTLQDANGQSPVFFAARAGLDSMVRLMLDAKVPPHAKDARGRTALYYAIQESRAVAAALILDSYGAGMGTGIGIMRQMANQRGLNEVEQRLEEEEQRENEQLEAEAQLQRNLLQAIRGGQPEQLAVLVEQRANLQECDSEGRSVLHLAAARSDEDAVPVCKQLIEAHNLSPSAVDNQRRTPLFLAAQSGLPECVTYLMGRSCDPDSADARGETPLFGAARSARADVVALLLEAGVRAVHRNARHQTALMCATGEGCGPVLRMLLEWNGSVVDTDKQGRTALFDAEDPQCVSILLDRRCDVNKQEAQTGTTALSAAAASQRAHVVRALLARQARPDLRDAQGRSALHCAAGVECVRLLIEARAGIEVRDNRGRVPLFAAARRGDVEGFSTMVEAGADPEARDDAGRTPLFCAALHAPPEAVRTLVEEAGLDPGVVDSCELSPAQAAMEMGATGPNRASVAAFLEQAQRRLPKATQAGREARQRYCLVIKDPSDPTGNRVIPFQTAEYDAALRKLGAACPWLGTGRWAADAPLTPGPTPEAATVADDDSDGVRSLD